MIPAMRSFAWLPLFAMLAACETGATQVLVTLGTDAPLDRAIAIRATVRTGNRVGGDGGTASWTRGTDIDGGITLPGTFTVVPAAGEPRDQMVTLVLEASLATGRLGEPAREFRRTARFTFTPRTTTALPIFLSIACGNPAVGCTAGTADCTLSQLCEERGQTCGDLGECVDPVVTPVRSDAAILPLDIPVRDVPAPPRDVGVQLDASDASTDATDTQEPDATDARADLADVVDGGTDAADASDAGGADVCGDGGTPCLIPTDISVGSEFTCVRMSDGTARCWGANNYGQLGDDTGMVSRTHAITVVGLTGAVELGLGSEHTCARLASGAVLCWGLNSEGKLGVGDTMFHRPLPDPLLPAIAAGGGGATQLAVETNSNCAVLGSGTAVCWGYNNRGQLGDGTLTSRASPTPVSGLSGVLQVAVGFGHGCAVLVDGTMRCWGDNRYGQLGNGTTTSSLTPVAVNLPAAARMVAVGYEHTCAITTTDTLYCWGRNDYGQLGLGVTDPMRMDPAVVRVSMRQVSAGSGHTCATRTATGDVYCWGLSNYGQLGDGTMASRLGPIVVTGLTGSSMVKVGRHHTCAIVADNTVRCWGLNASGQLGDDTRVNRLRPVPVSLVP